MTTVLPPPATALGFGYVRPDDDPQPQPVADRRRLPAHYRYRIDGVGWRDENQFTTTREEITQ